MSNVDTNNTMDPNSIPQGETIAGPIVHTGGQVVDNEPHLTIEEKIARAKQEKSENRGSNAWEKAKKNYSHNNPQLSKFVDGLRGYWKRF